MNRSADRSVCVVGSGWRFTSGISYYTWHLTEALLAADVDVSVILMRRLIPRRLYPGRARVGDRSIGLPYDERAHVLDGVDWFMVPGVPRALFLLVRRRPSRLVYQWWTAAVAHNYLPIVIMARLLSIKVIGEMHETQDTGEARIPAVARYGQCMLGLLLRLSDTIIVHSEQDKAALIDTAHPKAVVVPHGPFVLKQLPRTTGEDNVCRLLFFGTIRPYKGLDHLVEAFNSLPRSEALRYELTIVGETWEDWHLPLDLVERSPHRSSIRVINRYVTDDEVADYYASADVVVLPYLRSSASGPLSIAMTSGLPVIISNVPALREAVSDYEGALLIQAGDLEALVEALRRAPSMMGRVYRDPHTWDRNVSAIMK